MYPNVALKMLLILSIVLQSFMAVSATMEVHLPDAEHIQTTHDHKSDHDNISELGVSEEHDFKDCHHCDHCNGSHASWFFGQSCMQSSPFFIVNFFVHTCLSPLKFSNLPYRPPIA